MYEDLNIPFENSVVGVFKRPTAGFRAGTTSPRINGKLVLRSNPFTQQTYVGTQWTFAFRQMYNGSLPYYHGIPLPWGFPIINSKTISSETQFPASLVNQALSRFRARVHDNKKASLGVSLASYRETLSMIKGRVNVANRLADERIRVLRTTKGRDRLKRRLKAVQRRHGANYDPADVYLEGIFGWTPLITDIHDGLEVLLNGDILEQRWVHSRARSRKKPDSGYLPNQSVNWSISNDMRISVGALVTVHNPNSWMASRLGLTQIGTIAWDLVSFSFVVNMFLNVNQMISNFEPIAGISFSNESTTYTSRQFIELSQLHGNPFGGAAESGIMRSSSNWLRVYKNRVNNLPTYRFSFKLPNADVTLIGIGLSLLEQKFQTISKIVKAIR